MKNRFVISMTQWDHITYRAKSSTPEGCLDILGKCLATSPLATHLLMDQWVQTHAMMFRTPDAPTFLGEDMPCFTAMQCDSTL